MYVCARVCVGWGGCKYNNSEGQPYLGAAIGTEEFVQSHVEGRVVEWTKELENLITIILTQPHAAHAALTHGLSSKWSFLTHTIHGIGPLLQSLETITLTGQPPPNDAVCDLLALPGRLGGIAIVTVIFLCLV